MGHQSYLVSELRKSLSRLGMDVDGSKETLVSRLDTVWTEEEEE